MPYLAAIDDTESPAFTVYVDELVPVDDELVGLLVLVEPDTFNTWFGNIILEDKLFKDFNFEIDIPYLLDIDQRDSPLFTVCVVAASACVAAIALTALVPTIAAIIFYSITYSSSNTLFISRIFIQYVLYSLICIWCLYFMTL